MKGSWRKHGERKGVGKGNRWTKNHGAVLFVAAPYVILVLVKVVLTVRSQQPFVFADEMGYLGNARYLAGVAPLPDMRGTVFYHGGYSLLLIPAFWLFRDPVHVYKCVLLFNALLLSSLYFALYVLLHRTFEISKKPSIIIAFVSCCYPAFVLQSNVAWAENALIPGYAFLIVAFGAVVRQQSCRATAIFGLLAGFLYAAHPRNLILLPLACLHLGILTYKRIIPFSRAVLGIGIAGAVWWATRGMNNHLKDIGWGGGGEFSVSTILARVSSFLTVEKWSLISAGQIFYLVLATYGLVLVGISYGVLSLYKGSHPEFQWPNGSERREATLFLFSSSLGLLLTSTIFMALVGGSRGDHWFYGRYNEAFLAPYIALALMRFHGKSEENRRILPPLWAPVIAVLGALSLFLFICLDDAVYTARFTPVNVLGIYPVIGMLGRFRLDIAVFGAVLAFTTLVHGFRKNFRVGIILLLGLFTVATGFDYLRFFRPMQKRMPNVTTLAAEIRKTENVMKVSYDMSFENVLTFYSYQYLLPHVVFEQFASEQGEIPKSTIVISGKMWPDAKLLNAHEEARERRIDQVMWKLLGNDSIRITGESSFIGRKLGTEAVSGVSEEGFYSQEFYNDQPLGWTNGAAKLVVPVEASCLPVRLRVELVWTGPKRTRLQIRVNDRDLYHAYVLPGEWTKTFELTGIEIDNQMTIELLSDTFVPKETLVGSADPRTLGVFVRGIWLLGEEQATQ